MIHKGKVQLISLVLLGDKVELTEKDGIVTKIKLVADEEEPTEPEPEKLTAEAKLGTLLGIDYAEITLSDSSRIDEVEKVLVNGEEREMNIKGEIIRVNFGREIEEIKLVLKNGDIIDVKIVE